MSRPQSGTTPIQALEYDSVTHAEDEEVTGWMVQAFGHTGDTAHAEQYYRSVLQRAAGNFTGAYDAGQPSV